MEEINDISARIKYLVDQYAEGNVSRFAELVNTSEVNVRNYIRGTLPKYDFLNKVASKFDINCEWLLLGKTKKQKQTEVLTQESITKNEILTNFLEKRINDLEARLNDKERIIEISNMNNELLKEILLEKNKTIKLLDENYKPKQ